LYFSALCNVIGWVGIPNRRYLKGFVDMRSLYARLHRRYGSRISGSERKLQIRRHITNLQRRFPIEEWLAASTARPRRLRPTVVVVGAGFGGLAAGFLLAHDFKVIVLEARGRVGGRVHTIWDRSGRVTEAGGELIGYAHAFWLRLAEHFKLGLSVLTREDDLAPQNLELPMQLAGQSLSSKRQEALYEEMQHAFDGMCREARSIPNPYQPWRSAGAERRDNRSLLDWIESLQCSRLAKIAIETQFANDNGAPAARQSFLANLDLIAGAASNEHPDGFFKLTENVRCEDGNQALAEKLAEGIRAQGGSVELLRPVKNIELRDSEVVVTAAHRRPIHADYVILAVPPSAWRSVVLDPPIDPSHAISMGTVIKYLIQSDRRFWIEQQLAPSSGSDRIGVTWEATDNQMRGHNQNIRFNLFAGGDPARKALRVFEKSGLAAVHAFYDRGLRQIYKNYPEARIPNPRFVRWPLERWTWGGYSCPAPGEVCRIAPFLNQPYCRRLFFAGEHVCMPFFGYMEGALQSGAMVASKIIAT
jgi:monoamine oxidase